jgi:C4-dicarboxylate transporter DctM subunit
MTPFIIIGGVLGGVFTPTEAAGVASLYALITGIFITRDIKLHHLPGIFVRSGITAGIVLIVIATANAFAWILASEQIPQRVSNWIMAASPNPMVFLLLVIAFLLLVGCFMETAPALIILVPVLAPVATKLGINPIHFGFVFVYTLVIGLVTPPLGLCLFISCGIAKISLEAITKAILPFLALLITLTFLFAFVPPISLWLPSVFGLVE